MGEITDTNAQYISSRLRDTGVDIYKRITVGDNPARLKAAFEEAVRNAGIVIATGGLGPTADDITASALAEALGRKLEFSEDAWAVTLDWFTRRGRTPTEADKKQAMIVPNGTFLPNHNGTAPGQIAFYEGGLAAILPGPPREMVPMFENQVLPVIRSRFPDLRPLTCLDLKLVGIGESRVGEIVRDLMDCPNPSLAPYVGTAEVRLRIAARGATPGESARMVEGVEGEVRRRLGDFVYGVNADTLESTCGELMVKKGLTLAIAESVTGGLVAHKVTLVPGSSRYFKMGVVAYQPSVKVTCLGVPAEAVNTDEAVNPDVARSMAEGVRTLAGAKIGLATTGFAGPEGGTTAEPLGTVYTALAHEGGTTVDKQVFLGSRASIKDFASQRALYILWDYLRKSW